MSGEKGKHNMGVDLREFVAEDLWLLIGLVTFVLISLAGVVGLEMLAGVLAIIGWFLLVPIFLFWGEEAAALMFDEDTAIGTKATDGDRDHDRDAFEELKHQYASGTISEAEFEHRLDRLLEADDAFEDGTRPDRSRTSRNNRTEPRDDRQRRERERDREFE